MTANCYQPIIPVVLWQGTNAPPKKKKNLACWKKFAFLSENVLPKYIIWHLGQKIPYFAELQGQNCTFVQGAPIIFSVGNLQQSVEKLQIPVP